MTKDLISMFALTINRFETSVKVLENNLADARRVGPVELLVCDNGSTDRRIVDWVWKRPELVYHRVNSKNEGVGKSFNQLFLRSSGEFLAFTGSDLLLPPGAMAEMIKYAKEVPRSGLIGIDWGHSGVPPMTNRHGILGHWLNPNLNRVFGAFVVRRAVIEELGLFGEQYDVYGLEDSALNERINRAGYNSCYIRNTHFKCEHLGVGQEDTGEYRAMKDRSMAHNLEVFANQVKAWDAGASLVEPLPEMREPI